MQYAVDRAIALGGSPAILAERSRSAALRWARALDRSGRTRQAAPPVEHVSALGGDVAARDAIVLALETIVRELEPVAATFFRVGPDGAIASSVVHANHLPPAEVARQVRTWKATLRTIDPLAPNRLPTPTPRIAALRGNDADVTRPLDPRAQDVYRHLGVANDARLLIRDGDRVVAGVTLWRCWSAQPWTSAQLRLLRGLQPLVEMAYLAQATEPVGAEARLPDTLTRRERQVARLIARGVTNTEIARALHVSPNTAKTHTRAVLTKLGVGSRRELVRRFAQPPTAAAAPAAHGRSGAADLLRPARREPGDPLLWIEGTTTVHQLLLAPILGWAAERLGATVGGLATCSARGTLVAEACGTARPSAHSVDRRLLHELQRTALAEPLLARLSADASPPLVTPLDACATTDERARLTELTGRLGVAMPLVVVLRPFGRVAALAWVAQDERTADARDAVRELRSLHPLLELAYGSQVGGSRPRPATAADLAALRLTPRQLTVAQLALDGAGNDEIARRLRVAPSTVKNHMTRILEKSGMRSRMQLIATFGTAGDGGANQ